MTFKEVLIPEAVLKEILKGRQMGSLDVPLIESVIEEGWIKVRKLKDKPKSLLDYLGEGEKEAITLMKSEKEADWLLMDDEIASRAARLMNINVRPAVYLLIY